MHLEIINRYPQTTTHAVPLLFVHGAFARAQVWDEHFLPYFAQQGYQAHAVSLRGHGASAGHENMHQWGLADYVADLVQAVQTLDRSPVLIGHSMGGMVVQKYLESHPAPGVVLMASAPPQGLLPSLWGMAVGDPLLLYRLTLLQTFGPAFSTPDVLRQALFSDSTPDSQLLGYYSMLQQESQRASLDMLGLDPLRLARDHGIPMLVMGAGRDAFFSTGLIKDVAQHYQTEAVIFPDMAHAMMLESNWEQAALHLLHWLNQQFAD